MLGSGFAPKGIEFDRIGLGCWISISSIKQVSTYYQSPSEQSDPESQGAKCSEKRKAFFSVNALNA